MKKLYSVFAALLILAGCATVDSGRFALIESGGGADLHGIRVYTSVPPEGYPYQRLGEVEAVGTGFSSVTKKDEGLTGITLEAKKLGANAVIKTRQEILCPRRTRMVGEAVSFGVLPPAVE